MGTPIELQPYGENHGPAVIDLILNIQQNEFNLPITAEDQPDLADITGFYQRGCGNFWVAVQGSRVVGTIALLDIGNNRAALRKMFVHSDYRGEKNGTSGKLLNSLLAWTKEKNIREIYLGTTSRFLAAHRFYEKNGFIEIGKDSLPKTFPIMTVDTKFYRYPD